MGITHGVTIGFGKGEIGNHRRGNRFGVMHFSSKQEASDVLRLGQMETIRGVNNLYPKKKMENTKIFNCKSGLKILNDLVK